MTAQLILKRRRQRPLPRVCRTVVCVPFPGMLRRIYESKLGHVRNYSAACPIAFVGWQIEELRLRSLKEASACKLGSGIPRCREAPEVLSSVLRRPKRRLAVLSVRYGDEPTAADVTAGEIADQVAPHCALFVTHNMGVMPICR